MVGDLWNMKKLDNRHVGNPEERLNIPVEIMRSCDLCGKQGPGSEMINLHWGIGSPGHKSLSYFDAPEYWACSIEHWLEIAHAAIDEHAHRMLLDLHANMPESVHHDTAKEIKASQASDQATNSDQ